MKKLILASIALLAAPAALADTASTTNTATIGVQSNSQIGEGNHASNSAGISQSGFAHASGRGRLSRGSWTHDCMRTTQRR